MYDHRPPPVIRRVDGRVGYISRAQARLAAGMRSYPKLRRRGRRFSRRRRRFARKRRAVQPYSLARRLPTSFYNSLDAGAGALQLTILKLNSAYDPCGDGSATIQPMGMDQYESLYNRYVVVGWQLQIEFVSQDNTNPIVVGFTPTRQSSSLTSQHRYMELPGTVWKVVTPDIDKVVLTAKGSVKRWLLPGGGKLLTDNTLSATYGADPSKLLYGHIWVQCQDSSTDPAAVKYTAKLTQIVVFFDPIALARSAQ